MPICREGDSRTARTPQLPPLNLSLSQKENKNLKSPTARHVSTAFELIKPKVLRYSQREQTLRRSLTSVRNFHIASFLCSCFSLKNFSKTRIEMFWCLSRCFTTKKGQNPRYIAYSFFRWDQQGAEKRLSVSIFVLTVAKNARGG